MGTKFSAAVGLILAAALAIAGIGLLGLGHIQSEIDQLIRSNLASVDAMDQLNDTLDHLESSSLHEVAMTRAADTERLNDRVDQELMPAAIRGISTIRALTADEPDARTKLDQIEQGLNQFQKLRQTGGYNRTDTDPTSVRADSALADQTAELFAQMTTVSDTLRLRELAEAATLAEQLKSDYLSIRRRMIAGTAVTLLAGLGIVFLLIRNLVPRIRIYARFAGDISVSRQVTPLDVRGRDELADLGRALNQMVATSAQTRMSADDQSEFINTLQVTETEDEAHELLQHQLQRDLPGSAVTVLRRNNSENRLEAATAPTTGSDLISSLSGAEPRSCLAIRYSRTYRQGDSRPPLKTCGLCHEDRTSSTCEPLLVGGEVIGAVLVTHPNPLDADGTSRIATSVAQAAPVLANLRNLSLAEFRANNDSLTGLPNKRATEDTLKRMVAQANRSVTPLTAVMLDLDHFKQINDRFGHGKGDEVLAAVGAAMAATLRTSDFAGRYGGEEFLILLPDTGVQGAFNLAEKIRTAVRTITVPGVEREITASLGIADLFENARSATSLLREADRALYAAKAAGRDCTVLASTTHEETLTGPASTTAPAP